MGGECVLYECARACVHVCSARSTLYLPPPSPLFEQDDVQRLVEIGVEIQGGMDGSIVSGGYSRNRKW